MLADEYGTAPIHVALLNGHAQVAMILRTGRVAEGFTCFIQRVLIHTTKARLRADWDVDAQAGGCRGGLLAEAALLALAVGAAMGHSGRI